MKVMILGANTHQRRAIQRARELGYSTVAVDNRENSPGKKIADEAVLASTFDAEACLKAAKGLGIDGVFTSGTDQPVLTAALIQEAMQLPMTFSVELARKLTNKRWMKGQFDSSGLPTLPWALVGEAFQETDIPFSYPAVLKPVDSQGQRGIFLVESHEEVRAHLQETLAHSREKKALIEQHYPSDEVTVSGWVTEGEAVILSITDRETFSSKGQVGICLSHENPTRFVHSLGDELESLTHEIVKVFGIQNGPIYFQFLIGDKGIMINEIAGRIGGAHEDQVLPKITGFDLLGSQVRIALGEAVEEPQFDAWRNPPIRDSVQLFFVEPCKIGKIFLPEKGQIGSLVELGLHIHEGERIESIENATARAGYAIFLSESEEALERDVEMFYQEMKILDEWGNQRLIQHRRRERE